MVLMKSVIPLACLLCMLLRSRIDWQAILQSLLKEPRQYSKCWLEECINYCSRAMIAMCCHDGIGNCKADGTHLLATSE